jgi:protein MpaA
MAASPRSPRAAFSRVARAAPTRSAPATPIGEIGVKLGAVLVASTMLVAACATDDGDRDVVAAEANERAPTPTTDVTTTEPSGPPTTTTSTELLATTTSTSTTSTTTTTTTSTTTTTTTTTVPVPDEPGPLDLTQPLVGLGTSVEGRPIFAERYGTPGGRPVLVIGVIHGNEDDGVAIIDLLRTSAVPAGIELWLVESMNPDGQARQDRHNTNEVDLNRNFPYNWGPIGEPGNSQYAGPAPASEPETQAMVNFISQLRPDIAIWYHQDANLVIPSTGRDGEIRARYAELTGLPLADCCGGGGIYTGIAATWARKELSADNGVAFIVELDGDLPADEAATHAAAVLTVVAES